MLRSSGFASLSLLVLSAVGPAVRAQAAQGCALDPQQFGSAVVRCALTRAQLERGVQVAVRFQGSHDDTLAELTATLDGAPLECLPGSKTSIHDDWGDVALTCRVRSTASAPSATLVVAVQFSHAEYAGFEFVEGSTALTAPR